MFTAGKRRLVIWTLLVAGVVSIIVGAARASNVTYDVEFSDYLGGSTLHWLAKKGFEPKRDATNKNRVIISHSGSALVLETKTQAAGLLLSEINVRTYSKIRIKWGVDAFPNGASYAKGVRSESIMVYVFFGTEKIRSGSFLIPASPYFIGLFLCDSDPVGEAFKGRYFQDGGRYVCIDRAHKGQELITDFPIAESFKQLFGQSQSPSISGLGIGIDTESAKGNGAAKSFISEIELLE
jgi:Protein of unknown function (DUF3047)